MKTNYLIVLAILSAVGCSRADCPQTPAPCPTANTSNPQETIKPIQASAVEKRLQGLQKSGPAEDLAKVIAEVDEWDIAPEEEEQARKLIDDAIEELRARITSEVTSLAKAAVSAPKGKDAANKLSRINTLLSLYPVPITDAHRKSLEELSSYVLASSRRVEDIRRLRYNAWSVDQVQNGMNKFRQKTSWSWDQTIDDLKKLKMPNLDQDALLKTCTDYVKQIDPGFLEPAVMNRYAEFLQRCDAALDDGRKIKLAHALVDPSLQRRTPSDY